jgi:Glycine transporter
VSHEPTQLVVLDLIGVFVFALSGGLAGVRARLDIFGVLVLATVTAIGGGILRDTLIGSTPPSALRDWLFLAVPAGAGLIVFYWHPQVERAMRMVLVLDAAGLGLFTATGTRLARKRASQYRRIVCHRSHHRHRGRRHPRRAPSPDSGGSAPRDLCGRLTARRGHGLRGRPTPLVARAK